MASAMDLVEISSDDEDFPVAARKLPEWDEGFSDEDYNGFHDVLVVDELSVPPKKGKLDCRGGDEEDDDCVVLDSDPDKVLTVADDKESAGDGSSDELQIVAEKGPVACRDFPHSRHSCSNLPFNTTLHVKHCNMCHCFVCDAPAPCSFWGTGVSINDHCHATDKETEWKTLRQAFKIKSLPASHPEKHQNIVHPTIMSPRQQDIQCQVSVQTSQLSLMPDISRPSLVNQSHLLNVVSQNQQRHTSVRFPLNGGQTVCAQRVSPAIRAGRATANGCTPQITHSRPRFKRVGPASPGLATANANHFSATSVSNDLMHQTLPHISQPVRAEPIANAFSGSVPNNAPQRSFSAPITYQGQPVVPCPVDSNGIHGTGVTGPQLSRCSSLTTQRTQFMRESVMDVCALSWKDMLLRVASDLEVSDYTVCTSESQQPVSTSSPSLLSSANPGVGLHAEPVAATTNLMFSNGRDMSNHTADGNVQADGPMGPMQTTQTLQHLNSQSTLVPNEAHISNFISSPADGLSVEAAHQGEYSGLNSPDLLFDFELEDWHQEVL